MKTTRFTKPKYVGDPINAAKIFNDKEVDELIVLDIDASREGRGPNLDLIEELASECFMPLCYGGGIRSLEDARALFSVGIEKVAIRSAALSNIGLIREIADHAGEQAVVISVDVKRNWLGKPSLLSANAPPVNLDWRDFIVKAVEAGAGEVLINAVDRDGTMTGMDVEIIRKVSALVDVPTIAIGGVGSLDDISMGIEAGASAVAAGAYFVFHGPHRAVLITYPNRSELRSFWRLKSESG